MIPSKKEQSAPKVVELLNKALYLEYSFLIHYPRLASAVKDAQVKELVLQLGSSSMRHADVVADTISALGGTAEWSFDPFPMDATLTEIFTMQLQKERLALELHKQSADLLAGRPMESALRALEKEEEQHIAGVTRILETLKRP